MPSRTKISTQAVIGLVIAVLVAAAVGGGLLLDHARSTGDQSTALSPRATPEMRVLPTAAFLGDSYTFGAGASPRQGYAIQTATKMCWSYAGFGQGGTGYTNPGQIEQNESVYADRVPDVIRVKPDIVIIQGSVSDRVEADTYKQALSTYSALQTALPNVPIIVIGPGNPPKGELELIAPAREGVRRAASDANVTYFDPAAEDWLPPDPALYISDGIHPNDAGHTQMSERLESDLKTLRLPLTEACQGR